MTKTYTPLIIEGKIYVVVDAPATIPTNRDDYTDGFNYEPAVNAYKQAIEACTKYETLPEHAPYWEERIGKRVEVEIGQLFKWNDGGYYNRCSVCGQMFSFGDKRQPVCKPCCETTYAIPPQQKQGDEWDEAGVKYLNEAGVTVLPPQAYKLFFWFKSRYNLTKK